MTATLVEPEITAVHAPGTDLAQYSVPGVPEEYRARFVMSATEAAEMDRQLRDCMRAVLLPDVDYGLIPGMGTKPSLFKPGAEKLMQWFGYGFENVRDEIERDADGARIGVTYRCTVYKELSDGRKVTVATCEGYAGYDEDKFYTPAEVARAKAEAKEQEWARKDKRQPNPRKWENAAEYRAPWNSVLKMAQKRALVGAAIDATAAAGLFTQDLEDMRADSASASANAFAEVAHASIRALPEQVRNGLDRWYRGKGWAAPAQWSAEQLCTALQAAGYLSAKAEQPRHAPAGQQPASPDSDADQGASDGPADQSYRLKPDDPWLEAALGTRTLEDVEKIRDEVRDTLASKEGERERVKALLAVLDARESSLTASAKAAS